MRGLAGVNWRVRLPIIRLGKAKTGGPELIQEGVTYALSRGVLEKPANHRIEYVGIVVVLV